jgi:hypothetical protein
LSHSADCQTHRYRRNYPRVRQPSTAKEQRLTIGQNSTDHCVRAPRRKDAQVVRMPHLVSKNCNAKFEVFKRSSGKLPDSGMWWRHLAHV